MDYQERIAGGRVILHRNKENSIEKALEKFCHKGQQGVGCFCSFVCFCLVSKREKNETMFSILIGTIQEGGRTEMG